ncbi:23671_t:CDS:2 [Gigaspora rosea]|nr:23671_t:CDS:2 [Gigaspora rosea]
MLGVVELGVYKTANDIVEFLDPMFEEFAAVTKLSTSLPVSKPIANIFCAANTLQLSVNAGLEVASNLITKCKTLISLIRKKAIKRSSNKHLQNLNNQLSGTNDLENLTNIDYRRDTLINLLCPFHKTTKILSGSTYAALSIMVHTIEELIYHLDNTISKLDIISDVKDTILSNLSNLSRRWSSSHKYGMYASLLDPRFKNLSFSSSIKEEND